MRLQHLVTVVLLIGLAGLLVWVSGRYSWDADWTYGNRNTLTPASEQVLAAMPGRITVTAYAYPGPMRQTIRDAVDRYRRADDSVTLAFVDPAKKPQAMRKLGISRDGTLRIGYEGRFETLDQLSEPAISSALQRLSASGDQWVVFLSGHGERDPEADDQGGYSQLRAALDRQGLTVRRLNLAASPQVPDNTAVLVIASPQRGLLAGEVAIIGDYLAAGGNLLWLDDPSNQNRPAALAQNLGIEWLAGTAIYPDYRRLGTGDAGIALALSYPEHPITEALAGITLFPHAGGLRAAEKTQGWQTRALVRTPARSWLETGPLNAQRLVFDAESGDTAGPITLGLALTRPAASDQNGSDQPAKEQRAAVVADSDFLTNANIAAVSNQALGLGLIQWLGYRDQQLAVHLPAAPDASLQLAPWQGRLIWLVFVLLLPLTLLAAGMGRWWLRRRR